MVKQPKHTYVLNRSILYICKYIKDRLEIKEKVYNNLFKT